VINSDTSFCRLRSSSFLSTSRGSRRLLHPQYTEVDSHVRLIDSLDPSRLSRFVCLLPSPTFTLLLLSFLFILSVDRQILILNQSLMPLLIFSNQFVHQQKDNNSSMKRQTCRPLPPPPPRSVIQSVMKICIIFVRISVPYSRSLSIDTFSSVGQSLFLSFFDSIL
jgi:hypothetical protein